MQKRRTGRDETAEAVQLMAEASWEDRDRQQDADEKNQHPEALAEEADHKYDSAERPQEFAASFENLSDGEAVQARFRVA
ncbi:hypothetical protein [Kocuria sp. CPCC 205263]|uniref:hypothetical protein n=1 Tax=Kocuria sp. CPCC 205263 TaxID=3073555 RepID=UPI0034D769EA